MLLCRFKEVSHLCEGTVLYQANDLPAACSHWAQACAIRLFDYIRLLSDVIPDLQGRQMSCFLAPACTGS